MNVKNVRAQCVRVVKLLFAAVVKEGYAERIGEAEVGSGESAGAELMAFAHIRRMRSAIVLPIHSLERSSPLTPCRTWGRSRRPE